MMSRVDDHAWIEAIADRLYRLGGVEAVALGGSRAEGTHRADSDWDLGIYYRGHLDPQEIRDIGWAGEVFEIGAWGGGIFNGGAWLTIDGRRVDLLYSDLTVVERELEEARAGRFHREQLQFHLAGIPSYLLLAELAIDVVLRGTLPRPEFPRALRARAPRVWTAAAEQVFDYARDVHAPHGRVAECAGLIVQAAAFAAHAVCAAEGVWCTNEKTLVERAGLRDIDRIVVGLRPDPDALARSVEETRALCRERLARPAARG